MFNLGNLLGKKSSAQPSTDKLEARLKALAINGEAGGGLVVAQVNGKNQLVALKVDPSVWGTSDPSIGTALIVTAVNNALRKVETEARTILQEEMKGMLPGIGKLLQ